MHHPAVVKLVAGFMIAAGVVHPKPKPTSLVPPASSAPPASTTSPGPVATQTPAPSPPPPPAPAPPQPYTLYDSANPSGIPSSAQAVAVYATGPYAAQPPQGKGRVIWIDSNGSDPKADVLDIEPGCATVGQVAGWVDAHTHAAPGTDTILYTYQDEWPAVKAAVASLPASEQATVKYWIADPTGVPHLIPGSSATQYAWNGNSWDASLVSGF